MKKEYFDRIKAHPGIEDIILEYLDNSWDRFIYGNGVQAANCLGLFREMGVKVNGLLIPAGLEFPQLKGYWGRMMNSVERMEISGLTEQQISNSAVLIATPRETYQEVINYLKSCNFQHIYTCTWNRNQYLRDICMDLYSVL